MTHYFGAPGKVEELKKNKLYQIISDTYFESDVNEEFYLLFKGSQTREILAGHVGGIDSITIDLYVHTAMNRGDSFVDALSKNKKRYSSYQERINKGNELRLVFPETDNPLPHMVNIFLTYPEGSEEKKSMMLAILEEYYRLPIDEISKIYFEKSEYDKDFYDLFGVKTFERSNKKWLKSIDSITIDYHVFSTFNYSKNSGFTFLDFISKSPVRQKIYNLRKKFSLRQISNANNKQGVDKTGDLVEAVFVAPRGSSEKNMAVFHLLKHVDVLNNMKQLA